MTEFKWVRELNEGVKKIYSDMAEAGLPEPEYIETPNTVKMILRNNIDERMAHRKKQSDESKNGSSDELLNSAMSESVSKLMSELERTRMQMILSYLDVNKPAAQDFIPMRRRFISRTDRCVSRCGPASAPAHRPQYGR